MAYERKYPDSDRFQYCKDYQDGAKLFTAGSVVRATFADMWSLIEQGIAKEVPMYTLCRKNPLAAGGCLPETNKELEITEITQAGEKADNRKHSKK